MANLYKVECMCEISSSLRGKAVYVVAKNPNEAETLALNEMAERKYAYTDYVLNIQLIAKENSRNSEILVIAK